MAHQYDDHYNIIFQAYENMMTTEHKKEMQMTQTIQWQGRQSKAE
jgi:hypothetical protein